MIFETSTFPFKRGVLKKPDGEGEEGSSTVAFSVKLKNVSDSPNAVTERFYNSSSISNVISENEIRAVLPTPVSSTTQMSIERTLPTSSTNIYKDKESSIEDLGFILLPLLILLCIAIVSVMFYFMRKRKKLDDFRHRIIPVYSFPPGEEEEWGVLLDQQQNPRVQEKQAR